MSLQPAKTH